MKKREMSTTQYNSQYKTKVPVPPVLSQIERINLKNGAVIYPGTDGNIYGTTTSGTVVNLTNQVSIDYTEVLANIADLQARMASIEGLMSRAIALLLGITGVNITTQPPP
jgi:hypothetical protein